MLVVPDQEFRHVFQRFALIERRVKQQCFADGFLDVGFAVVLSQVSVSRSITHRILLALTGAFPIAASRPRCSATSEEQTDRLRSAQRAAGFWFTFALSSFSQSA